MYERLYPTDSRKPAVELHDLLRVTRVRHADFKVTLGYPPFERDGQERITGIRLRFVPAPTGAQDQIGSTEHIDGPACLD